MTRQMPELTMRRIYNWAKWLSEKEIMAKIVVAVGVPHPPRLVREAADASEKLKPEILMEKVREHVERASPDVIIELDSDHFVNFF